MSLTLYYHPLSSYCHKVLIALYEHHVTFEKRLIDLRSDEERKELQNVWPIGKFPVIRDHARNRDLPEATIIIEYLDHFFAGKIPLIPTDWDSALEVRLWDRIFDNYFQSPMQQIVGDRIHGTNGDLTREKATLDTAYKLLDNHMASKTWVASKDFSMADCAAVPALFYAGMVHPFPDQLTNLKAYFDRLVERPSVKRVLEEAKPYFQFFPFAEKIPKRFL
ncbi:MAG TPA: glutathione S-transferase family protein [Pseudomonadales bacterium]|nr:glutathione S-transferase family protein [Pseudomonadales bacterium]